MTAFSKINLSKLPRADVLETVEFETILAELKAEFITRYPDEADVIDLESSPTLKLLETAAYREVILRNRINQASAANMLATSTGADLDNLAALVPLLRLDGETDDAFRVRIQLAPEGFSTAGPRGGYEFHSRSVSPKISDVYIGEPSPGKVDVYILTTDGAVSDALIADVNAALSDWEVRPLTDHVEVFAYDLVSYEVTAQLVMEEGPDSAVVLNAAIANVEGYIADRQKFGKPVFKNGLSAALQIAGVENVILTSPAADIDVQPHQVAFPSAISVTVAGAAQ